MIMIGILTITLTITLGFAKITKLNQKFLSLYIGNRNRDKNGCNYNCPAENGEVCGRLITFAA